MNNSLTVLSIRGNTHGHKCNLCDITPTKIATTLQRLKNKRIIKNYCINCTTKLTTKYNIKWDSTELSINVGIKEKNLQLISSIKTPTKFKVGDPIKYINKLLPKIHNHTGIITEIINTEALEVKFKVLSPTESFYWKISPKNIILLNKTKKKLTITDLKINEIEKNACKKLSNQILKNICQCQ